ncbi:MAG: DUF2007 domain-containing protein [Planctomycetales bacterium]|nr:DUF2007 domain-containing protein [Planctomycetales bacterium]
MSDKLITIASYFNALEACSDKGLLENAGIPAFLENENSNLALSYIGSAVGGVRLMVPAQSQARAQELINNAREKTCEAWYCGNCQQDVDAGFEVCWNCGQHYSLTSSNRPVINRSFGEEEFLALAHNRLQDIKNLATPYSPPIAQTPLAGPIESSRHDEKLKSLWRILVLSMIAPLLLPFAFWTWISLSTSYFTFSPRQRAAYWWATAIGALISLGSGLLLAIILI